jgi:hypothetical protein
MMILALLFPQRGCSSPTKWDSVRTHVFVFVCNFCLFSSSLLCLVPMDSIPVRLDCVLVRKLAQPIPSIHSTDTAFHSTPCRKNRQNDRSPRRGCIAERHVVRFRWLQLTHAYRLAPGRDPEPMVRNPRPIGSETVEHYGLGRHQDPKQETAKQVQRKKRWRCYGRCFDLH